MIFQGNTTYNVLALYLMLADTQKKLQENQLKEARLKAEMLRLKRADSESFKSWLDDTHNAAKNFCSSNPKTGQSGRDEAFVS